MKILPYHRTNKGIIPASYSDSLSYLEQIIRIMKKLNETILELNNVSEYVASIELNFEEIQADIQGIKNQMANLTSSILTQVNNKLYVQNVEVQNLLRDYQITVDNQILQTKNELENEIEQIQLGNIVAYNPTNGQIENINVVLQNIFDINRRDAITTEEFDNLKLTATQFANKNLSAFDFDVNAKALLTA